jgi:hypothetical protein
MDLKLFREDQPADAMLSDLPLRPSFSITAFRASSQRFLLVFVTAVGSVKSEPELGTTLPRALVTSGGSIESLTSEAESALQQTMDYLRLYPSEDAQIVSARLIDVRRDFREGSVVFDIEVFFEGGQTLTVEAPLALTTEAS